MHLNIQLSIPDEIALVSEASVTLWTLVCLLFRRRRHVGGVVVEVLVPLEQLLLSEALVALVALVGLLVGVDQHVGLQVPLRDRAVRTQVALEAFFTLMRFLVHFQGIPAKVVFKVSYVFAETITVPVWKTLATHFTMHRFLTGVQLLDVEPQVCFAATRCGTKFALIHGLVTGVDGSVGLQTVALCEPRVANITLIGFLT